MPRCLTAIALLAILIWVLPAPAMACDHHAAVPQKASSPTASIVAVAQPKQSRPMNSCPGACLGACCCHGGMTSCAAGYVTGQAANGFDLFRSARGARLAPGGEQTVPYREPLYGLDRPPKA